LVWDDEIEIPSHGAVDSFDGPLTSSPLVHGRDITGSPSRPRRSRRSRSVSIDFPPPMRRTSTDVSGLPRPVSFSSKFPRINPGASGVAVLEHMERLDVVEAGLKRLGEEEGIAEEDEEGDIGVDNSSQPHRTANAEQAPIPESELPPPTFDDALEAQSCEDSDITTQSPDKLAKSLPHLGSPLFHPRWASAHTPQEQSASRRSMDWLRGESETQLKKTAVVERLEAVNDKPLLPCW